MVKIHDILKDYYFKSHPHKTCSACKEDWFQWVSCSPSHCCLNDSIIPCKHCGFWTGYGMTQEELDVFADKLKHIFDKTIAKN